MNTQDETGLAVLAYASKHSGSTVQIAKAIGKGVSATRMRLIALMNEGRISRLSSVGNRHTYGPLIAPEPEPAARTRPKTRAVVFSVDHQRSNTVSLPMEPPTQRLDEILHGITAQATQSRCAGENVGVLYAAGGEL